MNRSILLSFDVEEFDMPLEYGQNIALPEQLQVGQKGLQALQGLLSDKNITATLFTTATYAIHFPEAIKALAQQHEIASHTYYHSLFEDAHLLQSKQTLESICHTSVTGLRMPRLRKVAMAEVKKAGYLYDSSINPTWLPGRYNNLHLPHTAYLDEGVLRIPTAVTPTLNIPLFWLAFKNMPYALYKKLALQTLHKNGCLCLYFHPWEFTNLEDYQLPGYTKRWSGTPLLERLHRLVKDLQQEGDFIGMQQYATQVNNKTL